MGFFSFTFNEQYNFFLRKNDLVTFRKEGKVPEVMLLGARNQGQLASQTEETLRRPRDESVGGCAETAWWLTGLHRAHAPGGGRALSCWDSCN